MLQPLQVCSCCISRQSFTTGHLHPPQNVHPPCSGIRLGVYPIFLIFLTYLAVTLHPTSSEDKEASVQNVYVHQTGVGYTWLTSASTFLILSYMKISFDLLTPVYLKTFDGGTLYQTYLFNAGDLMYFGSERSVHADSLQHPAYCAAISDVIR